MIVIKCKKCGDSIYIRKEQKSYSCKCGNCTVDYGNSYEKITCESDDWKFIDLEETDFN